MFFLYDSGKKMCTTKSSCRLAHLPSLSKPLQVQTFCPLCGRIITIFKVSHPTEKQNTRDLGVYDPICAASNSTINHLIKKAINRPWNLPLELLFFVPSSITSHLASLSRHKFRHQVSVMWELGNGLLTAHCSQWTNLFLVVGHKPRPVRKNKNNNTILVIQNALDVIRACTNFLKFLGGKCPQNPYWGRPFDLYLFFVTTANFGPLTSKFVPTG